VIYLIWLIDMIEIKGGGVKNRGTGVGTVAERRNLKELKLK